MPTYDIKAGSPEAADLDVWWKEHVNESGVTVNFGPGRFPYKGLVIPDGLKDVHVRGADAYATELLPTVAVSGSARFFGIIGHHGLEGCSVEDLTIDCGVRIGDKGVSTGAYLQGTDNLYLNVRCIGLASSGPPLEAFGLQLNGTGGHMEDCIVEGRVGAYACGVTFVGEGHTARKVRIDLGANPDDRTFSGFAVYASRCWLSDFTVRNVTTGCHQDGAGQVPLGTTWADNVIRDSYIQSWFRTIRFAPVSGAQLYARYAFIRNTLDSVQTHIYLAGTGAPLPMISNFTFVDTTYIGGNANPTNAGTPAAWNQDHVFLHNDPSDALRFTDPTPCHVIP